ncbi:MAG: YcgN family cysteine cluster protein [Gammaproteobacteria bacterium]|nr:YcgN family cysteine cluster protein [Gammaproteobacteria bacterium]
MTTDDRPFWQCKSLEQMTHAEWEQVCDGCGLCCLVRVQDEDTEEIYDTNVVCRHYDCQNAKCSNYGSRTAIKDGCVQLTPELVRQYDWLPDSCAYRTLMRGDSLPDSHPLIAGTQAARNVVEIFSGPGLVGNSDKIDPACHLIAREDFDY